MSEHCNQFYVQQVTAITGCPVISGNVKTPNMLRFFIVFFNSSQLDSVLSQINAVNDLHSISTFPINRDFPTGQSMQVS
jgi:hypothetical protein